MIDGSQPVAVGDGAGLVEQDHVDVARRLDGPPAHRQHVEARDPVHAGDADRRQQAADRRRDEADEEGDERDRVDGRAGVVAERPEGHRRHEEDDRQPGQQDREGDLVRRPLPLGALDERDHPVEERLARIGRDADDEPVADQRRAAGDGAPDVGAGLLEDRGRFAGDRGLVDVGDALDDVAVARDRLAFLDDDDVALAELRRAHVLERAVGEPAMGVRTPSVSCRSVAAWARPRASATASAYVANRTVNHSQTPIWTWKPSPAGPVDGWSPVTLATAMTVTRTAVISTTNMTGFLMSRRGSSFRNGVRERRPEELGIEDATRTWRLAGRLGPAEGDEALEAPRAAAEIDGQE